MKFNWFFPPFFIYFLFITPRRFRKSLLRCTWFRMHPSRPAGRCKIAFWRLIIAFDGGLSLSVLAGFPYDFNRGTSFPCGNGDLGPWDLSSCTLLISEASTCVITACSNRYFVYLFCYSVRGKKNHWQEHSGARNSLVFSRNFDTLAEWRGAFSWCDVYFAHTKQNGNYLGEQSQTREKPNWQNNCQVPPPTTFWRTSEDPPGRAI